MSQNFHTCTGCNVGGFTLTGFLSHVRQSKDSLCASAYREQMGFAANKAPDHGSDINIDTIVNFQGDAFSSPEDYMAEDFGQLGDSERRNDEDIEDDNGWQEPPGWEFKRPGVDDLQDEPEVHDGGEIRGSDLAHSIPAVNQALRATIVRYSDKYPLQKVGAVRCNKTSSDKDYTTAIGNTSNPWAPFSSKVDWEVAKWAKLHGAGSTAFTDLLRIPGVPEKLDLSYKNSKELNRIIDEKLPERPKFTRREVVVAGEAFELYSWDILKCIKGLFSDPDFAPYLVFEPERHYEDADKTICMYHDMHTSKWWWSTQKELENATKKTSRTIIPVIISSDKTQLTIFRNKTAYPVYLTIGNLPKHIRRKPSRQGQVLLAYLPTAKLNHITNKAARRRTQANLFHACMAYILKPLEAAGINGIRMTSGDGAIRSCHPIFAIYVGDYPEQVLVTAVKTGECPSCPVRRTELGDPDSVHAPRELGPILDALDAILQGPTAFANACANAGIKPIQQPFWKSLPFVNIYRSITPDILHQLYQGLVKHLIGWIQSICSDAEIDARCRRLPPNHNIHLFMKGISNLSCVTGTEHDQICRFLLGLLIDIQLPNNRSPAPLVRAVRGILDFLNLARYPVHTTKSLDLLDAALQAFHDNKQIFIDLGIRANFNIPKLHYSSHYQYLIELYGSTDNYNTEYTERLHIDLAKNAYRATNSKDEYPQMTMWLDRREKVLCHDKYLRRRFPVLPKNPPPPPAPPSPLKLLPRLVPPQYLKMSIEPTVRGVTLARVKNDYGATHFEAALARWVVQYQNPQFTTRRQVQDAALMINIPFNKISIFHRVKFISTDPFGIDPLAKSVVDSVHIEPLKRDQHGKVIPGRFDTVLVNGNNGGETGVIGHWVGQVHCVFTLPESVLNQWFPHARPPPHLAYIDWFTPFPSHPEPDYLLYKISRLRDQGIQQSSVIPVKLIRNSVHLFPKFGPVVPALWTSSNVLEQCKVFYVNSLSDRHVYTTLY